MEISVQWNNIKDGYKGFEKLASKYVELNFPNPTWKKTKDTRDGNKDATAVFYGYQKNGWSEEQWWMEAKYSTRTNLITRYRLDSTIVSAILEKNLRKIIFITNIAIKSKTVNDIRTAIYNAIQCENIIFITKFTLEYWLASNPDIYYKYFTCLNKNFKLKMPDNVIVQNIEFYSNISNKLTFKEPLKELETNAIYIGYFEVFSSEKEQLSLKIKEKRKGIKILTKNPIVLNPGTNPISFKLKIENDYDTDLYEGKPLPSFVFGTMELTSEQYVIIVKNRQKTLRLPYQEEILKRLSNDYQLFLKNNYYLFRFIKGASGVGKSYILKRFISEQLSEKEDIFYATLYDSPSTNNDILINLILFILLPYTDPSKIDSTYLSGIQEKYISRKLIDLVAAREQHEKLAEEISEIDSNDDIFGVNITLNKRIIVLDNLHKLNTSEIEFLTLILNNIAVHNIPVLFIGVTQPIYLEKVDLFPLKYCYELYTCDISINDLIDSLRNMDKPVVYMNQNLALSLEFNVIELFFLTQELICADEFPNSFEEFIKFCKIFQSSRIVEEFVCKQFDSFFSRHSSCKEICDLVYWSSAPVPYSDSMNQESIRQLIDSGLIQRDYESMFIPYHDIYTVIYRKHYPINKNIISYFDKNSPEFMYFTLKEETNPRILNILTNQIMKMTYNKSFHSVIYILQGIFETESNNCLQRRWGKKSYYSLRFAYCLSIKQQGNGSLGYKYFEKLKSELYHLDDIDSLKILLEVYWELAISDYEKVKYEKSCLEIGSVLQTLKKINRLENGHGIRSYIKYHDVLMLHTLICANENKPEILSKYIKRVAIVDNYNFEERAKSFQLRFALTLCTHDIQKCLELLEDSMEYFKKQHGQESKYFLWGYYHYHYYKMVVENDNSICQNVINTLEKFKKNFYSNYRGRLNGMASYFYSIKQVSVGDQYLLKESRFVNCLDGRQEAFHYETVALHEIMNHNKEEAINNLNKAIDIFEQLPYYRIIPEHNLKLLKNNYTFELTFSYWWGEELRDNIYYIDSRCAW